ncbi:MAG: ArsA family ATPase [Chloroflexi bacterium]|nr:ArsA family ATPase [Chloroflexota bacterium]
MRIILYTGKGGVGKTSVAAATGLNAAERGYSALVISTDVAHSLADSFDVSLGPDPTRVAPNLWGQEIDVLTEVDRYWSTVRDWLAALMQWQGIDEVVAEELAVLPGMEELVGLLYITRYYEAGPYDVLIVDCAPTGETLRLLSFPDMARWYMQRLFPLGKRAASTLGPVARTIMGMPVPSQKVFDTVQSLYQELDRMHAVLTGSEDASVRLVMNPEKMVIKEAQRTYTYLNLYSYHTDLVVCNRVIPSAVGDRYFDAWKESQARYLQLIQESFSPVPILTAPLMDREVVGLDTLRELGRAIFGDADPTKVFYRGRPQEITRDRGGHVLKVTLPFVSKEQVSLLHNGDELVVQVGHYRRNIYLPRILAGLTVQDASLDGDLLRIRFDSHKSTRETHRTAP